MAENTPPGRLILVVDDDPIVIRSATTALAMDGFRVMVAENGAAGLECFLSAPEAIDLVLTDVIMPFMSGLEMAQRIKAIRADVPVLLMTGYSDAVIQALPGAKFPLIRKPFLPDDLTRAVWANIKAPTATA